MFEIINVNELLKRLEGYNHKELHVHHTWKPRKSNYNGNNAIELQEAMKNYHVNTNGWADIGQHVTLLPDGLFVTGRNFAISPASILGFNTNAFACEMIGNFDEGEEEFTGEQKTSMLLLAQYFYLKSKYIRFHRENASNTCPGTSIIKETFINEIKALGEKVSSPTFETAPGGNWVRQLQDLCNEAGFTDKWNNKLIVDGLWGELTASTVPTLRKDCDSQFKWFVKLMQKVLLEKGYELPEYGADGDFGNETLKAVKQFQKDNNLNPDGVVGKLTWARLVA